MTQFLPQQPITADGQRPSQEWLEWAAQVTRDTRALQAGLGAAEAKLAAIAAVADPAGGATVDAEARAAIIAIIDGAA